MDGAGGAERAAMKVADIKKLIETTQGQNVHPADGQVFIHQGKVLKDETTLEENKVLENDFIIIALCKSVSSSYIPEGMETKEWGGIDRETDERCCHGKRPRRLLCWDGKNTILVARLG